MTWVNGTLEDLPKVAVEKHTLLLPRLYKLTLIPVIQCVSEQHPQRATSTSSSGTLSTKGLFLTPIAC
jgi:hypothetical protein